MRLMTSDDIFILQFTFYIIYNTLLWFREVCSALLNYYYVIGAYCVYRGRAKWFDSRLREQTVRMPCKYSRPAEQAQPLYKNTLIPHTSLHKSEHWINTGTGFAHLDRICTASRLTGTFGHLITIFELWSRWLWVQNSYVLLLYPPVLPGFIYYSIIVSIYLYKKIILLLHITSNIRRYIAYCYLLSGLGTIFCNI